MKGTFAKFCRFGRTETVPALAMTDLETIVVTCPSVTPLVVLGMEIQ
jgi:hypothetical protein